MGLQNHVDGMPEHGHGNAAPKRYTAGLLGSRSIAPPRSIAVAPVSVVSTTLAAAAILLALASWT